MRKFHLYLLALLLLLINLAHADIVDTWQFTNTEQQTLSLKIAAQLRCPQCQNQNLLGSNAPTAVSMRHQVYKMVAEGKTEPQILSYMTERYGDFVLYNPPLQAGTLILWAVPFVALLFICLFAWRLLKHRSLIISSQIEKTIAAQRQLSKQLENALPMQTTNKTFYPHNHSLIILIIIIALVSYFLLPRFTATYHEYQRLSDPLQILTPIEQQHNDFLRLQSDIRQSPENGELWAILGEYYLYQNSYDNALIAYTQALKYSGESAQLYSAIATVLYYQAGQHMTDDTLVMINKSLSLDKHEVTALMLLASDAFMNANYAEAINLWQILLDSNNSRINRKQLIEAINMAKTIQRK